MGELCLLDHHTAKQEHLPEHTELPREEDIINHLPTACNTLPVAHVEVDEGSMATINRASLWKESTDHKVQELTGSPTRMVLRMLRK